MLGLDLPGTLPRLQLALASQQRIHEALEFDDLSYLVGERHALALAPKRRLPTTKLGGQTCRRPRPEADRRRILRTKVHAA
jgi:hypothetical protein